MQPGANYSLRDEIKAYWSARAATFDAEPGHEIFSEAERVAWHRLILRHLGPGKGRAALDLATGTGVIAHLMDDMGFRVTGLDWAEPMLERASAKAKGRGRDIRFVAADAEFTTMADAAFDVAITRHLVWTLVDPPAAFAEWRRVLRPGGRLMVIDGDFVTPTWLARLAAGLRRGPGEVTSAAMRETHRSILSRVAFSKGARAGQVAAMLREAGFGPVVIDCGLGAIRRAQARQIGGLRGLDRLLQHRYAIVATVPGT